MTPKLTYREYRALEFLLNIRRSIMRPPELHVLPTTPAETEDVQKQLRLAVLALPERLIAPWNAMCIADGYDIWQDGEWIHQSPDYATMIALDNEPSNVVS